MLNYSVLMGRPTTDIELRHTTSGTAVASFTIAVDRRPKQGEEKQADFINIVTWGKTAEFAANYIKKGQLIAVEGSIQTRKYQDKDGNNRTAFEVVANNVHFAESKKPTASNGGLNINPSNGNDDFAEFSVEDDLPF